MAQYPSPKLPSLMSVHCKLCVTLALKHARYLVQQLIWSSVRGFKVWRQKQWGTRVWVSNQQPLCSLLGEKEPTAFVRGLWWVSQSKWSLIFCKLLLVQVPAWWLTFMMPNPNFSIQSQTKIKQKGKKPKATPPSFRIPISHYHRLSLKKQSYFFLNQFTIMLMCHNGHFWIVASAS